MGVVWEARDERLNRTVAVKLLRQTQRLDPHEAELANSRALREARITARLDHPHAVSLLDVVDHEGRPCLIMQLVPSASLAVLIKGLRVLSVAETLRLGIEVGSALAAAHRLGIVHGDVKPANVLVADDGTARISDFGISNALDDALPPVASTVHGTPAFLAPEVARGGLRGFASDVFGPGATLYAAVEGAPPFGTDQDPLALLRRVASGRVDPPRSAGALTPLLLDMLSAEPAERPSMNLAVQSLTDLRHTDAHPVTAPVPAVPASGPPASPVQIAVPFEVAAPTWLAPAPRVHERDFVTWQVPDVAVRFLLPTRVYPPGRQGPAAAPRDYPAYLLAQTEQGAHFTDQRRTTVGGHSALVLTATADRPLTGAIGCRPARGSRVACYGLRPDRRLRLAVVDVSGTTLLIWLRHDQATGFAEQVDLFEQMLSTVRFR
jgi:hypothetical protein